MDKWGNAGRVRQWKGWVDGWSVVMVCADAKDGDGTRFSPRVGIIACH